MLTTRSKRWASLSAYEGNLGRRRRMNQYILSGGTTSGIDQGEVVQIPKGMLSEMQGSIKSRTSGCMCIKELAMEVIPIFLKKSTAKKENLRTLNYFFVLLYIAKKLLRAFKQYEKDLSTIESELTNTKTLSIEQFTDALTKTPFIITKNCFYS